MMNVIIEGYSNPRYGSRYRVVDAEMTTSVINDSQGMGFSTYTKAENFVRAHEHWTLVPNPDIVQPKCEALF